MEAWRRELYLAHHGIKGQRWGVRKGPPYPLDAQDHSAAEKKAGWRKSLNGGAGEESKPKKRLTKGSLAGNIKGGSDEEKTAPHDFDKEKTKRLARNVAIGVAAVGLALGGVYVYKHREAFSKAVQGQIAELRRRQEARQKQQAYKEKAGELERTVRSRGHGNVLDDFGTKRRSYYLSRTPINELSDDDEIIRAGAKFQRIISAESEQSGIMAEKVKDIMYAAYEEGDKSLYYHQFLNLGKKQAKKGENAVQKLAMQMTANKDIKIASDRKRVQVFMDLMRNDTFRRAFRYDRMHSRDFGKNLLWLQTGDFNKGQDWTVGNEQRSYRIFQHLLGDENSKARKMYIDKLVGMGYNAIVDDNDANAFAHKPIILLSAQSDVTITGAQAVNEALDMLNLAKLDNINDLLDGKK